MDHKLDNPVWNALVSGNSNLSNGNEVVKYFFNDVSPFAGLKDFTRDNFDMLYRLIPFTSSLGIFSAEDILIPSNWKIKQKVTVYQMICQGTTYADPAPQGLVKLTELDVPAMIKLTAITNPGPFFKKTINFGNYFGIFKDKSLVAMTGQRLQVFEYSEVSAVCTHPDHLGHGYARQLILNQLHLIKAVSKIPFLHVKTDNSKAVKLYESLGFETRKEIIINIIQKR